MSEIIKSFKSENAFYFYRGRVALYAILKSIGIKEGDEIILQAFTCMAVPLPILNLKAKPVYIDIDASTLSMNPDLLEGQINSNTKAIIVQHTLGIPAPMDRIKDIATRRNLFLIEDCCHTIGTKFKGQEVGTFGHAAFYSFEWGKPIIAGLGGCAIINDKDLKNSISEIYKNFEVPPLKELIILEVEYLIHFFLRFQFLFWLIKDMYKLLSKLGIIVGTFRASEFEGEISPDYNRKMFDRHKNRLFKKLNHFQKSLDKREIISKRFKEELKNHPNAKVAGAFSEGAVLLKFPLLFNNKNEIIEIARKNRIEVSDIFKTPVHPLKEEELRYVKYSIGSCPVAEKIANEIISLPAHDKLSKSALRKSIALVEEKIYLK